MSTLGGRLGLAAMQRLAPGDVPVTAEFGVRTCALDGIAEATGCREENGSLRLVHDGRHVLTLRAGDERVTVLLLDATLQLAGCYRELCNELEDGWETLPEDERQRRRAVMDAALDELLPQFWNLPDEQLLDFDFGVTRG